MEIHTLMLYLIASIILFIILNNQKKLTITNHCIISCIYILFMAGICTTFHLTKNNDSIFIIFLFEFLLRISYNSMIKENNIFLNKETMQKEVLSFICIFLLNTFLISKVNTVFLNEEQTKLLLWLLIIIYIIYQNKNSKKEIKVIKEKKQKEISEKEQKKEDIIIQYAKLKNKYAKYITTKIKELQPLIYGIMIHENKNRPAPFRKLDYYLYKINRKAKKFGIMQIYSKYYIDDENSIEIAIRRLERIYNKYKDKKNIEKIVLNEYYKKDYITKEILYYVKQIKKFNQK